MKVNSEKALALGRKVRREHGSWGAVKKASYVREDGITVVRRSDSGRFVTDSGSKSGSYTQSSKK